MQCRMKTERATLSLIWTGANLMASCSRPIVHPRDILAGILHSILVVRLAHTSVPFDSFFAVLNAVDWEVYLEARVWAS